MKLKTKIAFAVALSFFAAAAQAQSYRCDAQVTNIPTGEKGPAVFDAGTLSRHGRIWTLTLETAAGKQVSRFGTSSNAPVNPGFPEDGVHFFDGQTTFDLLTDGGGQKGTAVLYVTPNDDSGNQMRLDCDLIQ